MTQIWRWIAGITGSMLSGSLLLGGCLAEKIDPDRAVDRPAKAQAQPLVTRPKPTQKPAQQPSDRSQPAAQSPQPSHQQFLVLSGGGSPESNEIAIEKNVLYFQRTLKTLGFNPKQAAIWFANGNTGEKTVRFLDKQNEETFKAPEIHHLNGASTVENVKQSLQKQQNLKPLFFYFTGHGYHNKENENDNAMILWKNRFLTVKKFTKMLDQLPPKKPVVSVMVQCYAGAFANLIYEGGNPKNPVAHHDRCGFFATVKQLPSVGCTPEVNEADYEDYSSSFFAGLSGINRVGQPVESADYDRNGRIAFREAHAFAKVDEQAADLPISTSEAWLQEQLSKTDRDRILEKPINQWLKFARPEQRHVVTTLTQRLKLNPQLSLTTNLERNPVKEADELANTYAGRLTMELWNIGAEQKIRQSSPKAKSFPKAKSLDPKAKPQTAIGILEKLLNCEAASLNA
ncbi:Caspase domain-containing protein [Alkalinema pantanalense CENA528]|uniref:Caspase domain-containing protein n=1 Tax=Alkalinema pantanalense TaxID=1620705 RepID=UPI003D6DC7AD